MKKLIICAVLATAFACSKAPEPEAPKVEAPSKRAFFIEPANGASVSSPVKVKMGVEGMTVEPAGKIVEGTGHFHIIIDAPASEEGKVVPADDSHKHYGKGQKEADLTLKPGKHKLVLQFADGEHKSYGEKLTDTIEITVK
jgi:hypothetical protein